MSEGLAARRHRGWRQTCETPGDRRKRRRLHALGVLHDELDRTRDVHLGLCVGFSWGSLFYSTFSLTVLSVLGCFFLGRAFVLGLQFSIVRDRPDDRIHKLYPTLYPPRYSPRTTQRPNTSYPNRSRCCPVSGKDATRLPSSSHLAINRPRVRRLLHILLHRLALRLEERPMIVQKWRIRRCPRRRREGEAGR